MNRQGVRERQLDAFVDPRGDELSPSYQSPKPTALSGIRLGLLDNTKWNAVRLLQGVAERIDKQHGLAEVIAFSKPSWGQPAEESLNDRIAADCQAVITASGD